MNKVALEAFELQLSVMRAIIQHDVLPKAMIGIIGGVERVESLIEAAAKTGRKGLCDRNVSEAFSGIALGLTKLLHEKTAKDFQTPSEIQARKFLTGEAMDSNMVIQLAIDSAFHLSLCVYCKE